MYFLRLELHKQGCGGMGDGVRGGWVGGRGVPHCKGLGARAILKTHFAKPGFLVAVPLPVLLTISL